VAAFAQFAAVGRGSNTCDYVIEIFKICESTEQCICIKFCFKIGKTATEKYQLLQQAYGEDAMSRTEVPFECFRIYGGIKCTLQSRAIILEGNKTSCLLIIPHRTVLADLRYRT
jgi:hypothetical protein